MPAKAAKPENNTSTQSLLSKLGTSFIKIPGWILGGILALPRWLLKKTLHHYIDVKIKKALQFFSHEKKDKTDSDLDYWLALAAQYLLEKSPWQYSFADGQLLADFILNESNRLMEAYIASGRKETALLHKAQTWLQVFYHLTDAAEPVTFSDPSIGFRIFGWIIKLIGLTDEFYQSPLTPEEELTRLKNRMKENIKKDSKGQDISAENYSPAQLIDKGMGLRISPKQVELSVISDPIPKPLQQWRQEQSLDQQITYEQIQNRQQIAAHNSDQGQHKLQQLSCQQYQDQSSLIKYSYTQLKDCGHYTSSWLSSIEESLLDRFFNQGIPQFKNKGVNRFKEYYGKFEFYISDEAKNILIHSPNILRNDYHIQGDLENLPLGFFLEQDGIKWILKYSEAYRQDQLKNVEGAELLLDPAAYLQDPGRLNISTKKDPETRSGSTKTDLLHALKRHNITLSTAQQKLLTKIDTLFDPKTELEKMYVIGVDKTRIFRALKLITEESTCPDQIVKILDILLGYDERDKKLEPFELWDSEGKYPLLEFFLKHHLVLVKRGTIFDQPRVLEYLSRLTYLDPEGLLWFQYLSKTQVQPKDIEVYDFEELAQGLFYFYDFFKRHELPLPKRLPESHTFRSWIQVPITQLKNYLDCIALLAKDKKMQQFQLSYFHEMPLDTTIAKELLRNGYNFVHESMSFGDGSYEDSKNFPKIFEKFFPQVKSPFYIRPEEFASIEYPSAPQNLTPVYYRTLFLRFIAYNVQASAIPEAIKYWEELTRSRIVESGLVVCPTKGYQSLTRVITKRWEDIKTYALGLPRKTQQPIEKYIPKGMINGNAQEKFLALRTYKENDISSLFNQLKLAESLRKILCEQIRELNQLNETYYSLTAEQLEEKLKAAKSLPFIEQFALLREAYARLSANEKNPQGIWIRLEQVVSILICMDKKALLQVETSEGKTLIIQFLSLLMALAEKKVYVLTHNEVLAEQAYQENQQLAHLLGLTLTTMNNSNEEIAKSAIHYIDIANAVLRDRFAQLANQQVSENKPIAIIDEVDYQAIDAHAYLTLQISQGAKAASEELIQFLRRLNKIIREELIHEKSADKTVHRQFIKNRLGDDPYYNTQLQNDKDLDFWIKAVITGMAFKEQEDYVIKSSGKRKVLHLVHKDTTGRQDKLSQWSAGVYSAVTAWEREQGHMQLEVPDIAEIIAEGDIASYLQNSFDAHYALSGTLGEPEVEAKIKAITNTELTVLMPRAKREAPAKNIAWPRVFLPGGPVVQYHRSYHFPPIYTEGEEEHQLTIVEALKNAHLKQLSSIVFFNTIKECNQFFDFLMKHHFTKEPLTSLVQIFDDTQNPEDKIRPSEEVIVANAHLPKMITLTTAAGSRGTNFKNVTLGIIATPGLGRIVTQKKGRVGRNAWLGIVYEIYNRQALRFQENDIAIAEQDLIDCNIENFSQKKQKIDLTMINAREKNRLHSQKLQELFFARRKVVSAQHPEKLSQLDKAWVGFFSKYKQEETETPLENKLEQLEKLITAQENFNFQA